MSSDGIEALKAALASLMDFARYVERLNECEAEVVALTRELQEAEDMANVGRSLMEQIKSNAESLRGWSPVADPAEVVVHLINERDEAVEALKAVVDLWYKPSSLTELGAAVKMGETARNALAALTERSKS